MAQKKRGGGDCLQNLVLQPPSRCTSALPLLREPPVTPQSASLYIATKELSSAWGLPPKWGDTHLLVGRGLTPGRCRDSPAGGLCPAPSYCPGHLLRAGLAWPGPPGPPPPSRGFAAAMTGTSPDRAHLGLPPPAASITAAAAPTATPPPLMQSSLAILIRLAV